MRERAIALTFAKSQYTRVGIVALGRIMLLAAVVAGCARQDVPASASVALSGPPRHWDVGDQALRHKLPPDVSDGYLQFAKSPHMSYGLTLAHERISARSHQRSDMLIYLHDGVGRFHVGDKDFTAATGDILFVPRRTIYSVESVTKRQLQLLTIYAPTLDPDDVTYHEAAERVVPPPTEGKMRPLVIDTVLSGKDDKDNEEQFLKMDDYKEIKEGE